MSDRPPPLPSSSTLPIRTRCVLGAGGLRSIALLVFCPVRASTVAVDVCERCPRLSHIDARGDRPAVACDTGLAPSDHDAHVGALARPVVLCVVRDTPLESLEGDASESRVIPVVDEAERYVGAIVRGRSSAPPSSRDPGRSALSSRATAEDVLERLPTVNERADVVTAAVTMTSTRARCLPVVNDARRVVGLLDDVALLASIARARRASTIMKRCSCGDLYTRERWSALPLVGVMPTRRGETIELRNCETCGSTMAVPSARVTSDVA